jgi:hypothetical protein
MRKVRTAVLTGIAALAVAGAGLAAGRDMHSMKVDLPDGSVARIEYQGDVAPRVTFAPASHVIPVAFLGPFDSAPFAAFDRIAAEMDRQTEAMIHEVSGLQPALSPGDGKLDLAALGKLPPATVHYRFVSTSDGSGTCDRSIEVTSYGSDQSPKVISSSAGDCKAVDRTLAPAWFDAPARPVPGLTRTDAAATAARPHVGTTV